MELNHLKELVASGRYRDALEFYATLTEITALDERTVGRAYWGLGDFQNASQAMARAYALGEIGAAVDELQLKILERQNVDIREEVKRLAPKNLLPRDRLQLRIIEGEYYLRSYQFKKATQIFISVWVEAQHSLENQGLISHVGHSLALAYHQQGLDREAIPILEQAIITSRTIWHDYLILRQVESMFWLGNYLEAQKKLNQISQNQLVNPLFYEKRELLETLLLFIEHQNFDQAIQKLTQLEHNAVNRRFTPTTFYLLGLFIADRQLEVAHALIKESTSQGFDQALRPMLELRHGQYLTAIGEFKEAIKILKSAYEIVYDHDQFSQQAIVKLHLAYAQQQSGQELDAQLTLDQITDLCNLCQNAAFLNLEKRFIGNLEPLITIASSYGRTSLETDRPLAPIDTRPAPITLTLVSLNKSRLLLDGQIMAVKLNRAMPLLAYLQLYQPCPLEQILKDVFEGSKSQIDARNYFHTTRFELNRACPSIKLVYDRNSKTYSIETEGIKLEFDYLEFKAKIHSGNLETFKTALNQEIKPFLSEFEGAWIEEIRHNTEWQIIKQGLWFVQQLYQANDFAACQDLSKQLLKVEPLDESLNELLVRATREVEGALASREAMKQVESQFLLEVGELPPTLAELKKEMKNRLN
jgi:tetratricopeptide (TPR) repeat protein